MEEAVAVFITIGAALALSLDCSGVSVMLVDSLKYSHELYSSQTKCVNM